MDKTPDEVAYQLREIANSAQNIISAVTSSAASPGGSITFRYTDHNGTRSVTGTAHTAISPGNVQAMRTNDGQWIVFGTPTSPSREALHESRRRRAKPDEPGKVKILCFKDGALWIGGDRPNPKRIYTIPEGARLDFDQSRIVNKGGGDKWIVTFVLIGNDRTGIVVLQSGVGTLWEIWMDDPRLSSLAGPRPVLWTQTGLWTLFSGSGDDTTFIYAGEVYGSLGESPLNYINGRPDFVDPKAGTAIYTRSVGLDIQVLFWDGATETEVPLLESFPLGAPTFIKDTLYSCLTEGKTATITKISLPSGDTSTRKTKVFPIPNGYTRLDVGFHP
ncbi:hypothetical protein NIES2135_21450 [Leptolyngbya boryana NIES-2135]|uniref:Uncharacterized protein n=1 Tax=Leptolyngbya boryana NIES-2135 TaxID=1973484 RepID=A0A1Z4JEX8_LEPBY|nr:MULTISPECIES: hypothetical protein [Leptolyngbya]BAY55322.1 hypothetical protein NIES2135_21450 [Leptolyngbya boryana NIES-2135]MBD2369404.1 hypothetical protein [Leptolyngbya sp. FACHB-161]ULP32221.1 hypothetical protein MCP04_10730 [Leptolyngbya boryana IU 594]BAS59877.1 hypothetical protein LBWT_A0470 [Leptolyngbya boryana IAM M-101]BAS66225.1 hypothetical protein LBDG_A0470 [Leptolyngbya boryana dg5]